MASTAPAPTTARTASLSVTEAERGAQLRAEHVADERGWKPEPAMQAARGDAAEERTDVAAVSDSSAVSEHQSADDGCGERAPRCAPRRGKATCCHRRDRRAEHDPEVHHRCNVAQHTRVKFRAARSRREVPPRLDRHA